MLRRHVSNGGEEVGVATRRVLEGLRVVDLTSGMAGPYCTKLFVDAGAEVIKVEPPSGDPLRSWSATDRPVPEDGCGLLFSFLNAGKKSVVADLWTEEGRALLRELLVGAELVVEDFGPGVIESLGFDLASLQSIEKRLSLLSLSRFGRGGPWSDRVANEFTLQAQVGSTDARGIPGEEPVTAGGRLGEYVVASFAAVGGLGAVLQSRATGQGVHVDTSQYESMILSFQTFRQIFAAFDPGRLVGRSFEIPSIEPAADGWVGFCTITSQQYSDFCSLIGAPELAAPEMMFAEARMAARDAIWAKIREYTEKNTVADILELASAMRIPVSPVGNGATVLEVDHFAERGVFVDSPHGFKQPRVPYSLSEIPARPFERAPRLGEHTDSLRGKRHPLPRGRRDLSPKKNRKRKLPLEGVKVADFSAFWAGPVATSVLGALGADVIKIESIQRPDGMRFAGGIKRADVWEFSAVTHAVIVGKRDVTLDLTQPEGLALAKRLVEWADLVVENFAPRVMENFGLGWKEIHALNPRAVMCRMPAFGLSGPWRERTGFAMTIEQASGMAWITGHASDPPMVPRGICDPLGGMHAAFAMMLALDRAAETGRGQLVEVPLIEPAFNAAAELVIEWSAHGVLLERQGNRSPHGAPQGLYPAREDDQWVALSIETDAEWGRLRQALGDPEWARDPCYATAAGRHASHDALDAHLRAWFAGQPRDLAAETLIAAGVPAAPLRNASQVHLTPHHQVRAFHQWMRHPVAGWTPYLSFPFTWNGEFLAFARPAPTLGQHNHEVLSDVLGLEDAEIAQLAERKVIGTRPAWM
jgi:crotonobetainyl-CoA:carnitine CoA-transferase CaiB-like acyl-CoA transferase